MKPNNIIEICVFIGDEALHANQFFVGLGKLSNMGLVNVSFKASANTLQMKPFVECIINNINVVFDFHDRAEYIDAKAYNWSDYYFKRTVTVESKKKYSKVYPWGLNLYINSDDDFGYKRAMLNPFFLKKMIGLFRSNSFLSNLLHLKNGKSITDLKSLYHRPVKHDFPYIIFSPRLWDPGRVQGEKREERIRINNERIQFVRLLMKHFSGYFIGGIEDTEYARRVCPDLIIPLHATHKKKYLSDLKIASIGLATPGLAASVGWKLSEYVTFSKAIICNDLSSYLFNGPFEKAKNYISYEDEFDMLQKVELLLNDSEMRYAMMEKNFHFATEYLDPVKQLQKAFGIMGIECDLM